MSVLVIWSSPNQDGLTAAAKEAVLAGLKAAGTEAEAVQLNKLKGALLRLRQRPRLGQLPEGRNVLDGRRLPGPL